jgi:hypothetical protein
MLASAFVARWRAGSKVETAVCFMCERTSRRRGLGRAASAALNSSREGTSILPPADQRQSGETRDLSQRVAEFALSKPRRGQERKCQPYSCPKDE